MMCNGPETQHYNNIVHAAEIKSPCSKIIMRYIKLNVIPRTSAGVCGDIRVRLRECSIELCTISDYFLRSAAIRSYAALPSPAILNK